MIGYLEEFNLGANVEIKPTPGTAAETTQKTIEMIDKLWPDSLPAPLVTSFNQDAMSELYKLNTDYPIGLLSRTWDEKIIEKAKEHNAVTIHFKETVLTAERCKQIKDSSDCLLLAYTLNHPERAKELFSWGVDSVFSDFPDKILEVSSNNTLTF